MRPKALTAYYYPGHWIHFNAALTVHNFHSPERIPCLVPQPIMALANSNTIICHLLPGPHLYTWVESSNVDKLPCWRTKVPRRWWDSNPGSQRESRVNTPIYHFFRVVAIGKRRRAGPPTTYDFRPAQKQNKWFLPGTIFFFFFLVPETMFHNRGSIIAQYMLYTLIKTYFFRATLNKIQHIEMNIIWTQMSYSSPHKAHLKNQSVALVKREKNVVIAKR